MNESAKKIYFQLNYIETLFFCSKMVYSCCFSLGGDLYFLDFLQKKFYNINYWKRKNLKKLFVGLFL